METKTIHRDHYPQDPIKLVLDELDKILPPNTLEWATLDMHAEFLCDPMIITVHVHGTPLDTDELSRDIKIEFEVY